MLPSILILDDEENRINWIRKQFPGIHIIWTYNVKMFFEEYQREKNSGRLILIILDHDLGSENESGMDVVKKLQTNMITIIWSVNTIAATKMFYELKDKKVPTLYIPYIHQKELKKAINEFYTKFLRISVNFNNKEIN